MSRTENRDSRKGCGAMVVVVAGTVLLLRLGLSLPASVFTSMMKLVRLCKLPAECAVPPDPLPSVCVAESSAIAVVSMCIGHSRIDVNTDTDPFYHVVCHEARPRRSTLFVP